MDLQNTYVELGLDREGVEKRIPREKKGAPFVFGALILYIVVGVAAIGVFLFIRITPPPTVSAIINDPVDNLKVVGELEEPKPQPEPEPQEESVEPNPYEGMEFYKYVTSNRSQSLYVRRDPGMKGLIVERLRPGSTGYVVFKGLNWSYLSAGKDGKLRGYSFNYYLDLEEITPQEMPEDILEEAVKLFKEYGKEGIPGTDAPGIIGSGGMGIESTWPYENAPQRPDVKKMTEGVKSGTTEDVTGTKAGASTVTDSDSGDDSSGAGNSKADDSGAGNFNDKKEEN